MKASKILDGFIPIDEILKYKKIYTDMPEDIIKYHQRNPIIMNKQTMDSVLFRQHHPILKKFEDIGALKSKIISQLNRISDENCDEIIQDILKIDGIQTSEGIEELCTNIIKNIFIQKQHCELYASICGKLSGKCDLKSVIV